MLIGADGRNSRVAKLLHGIDDEDGRIKEASSDRIGVQFTVKRTDTYVVQTVLMFLFDGGYGGNRRSQSRLNRMLPWLFLEASPGLRSQM